MDLICSSSYSYLETVGGISSLFTLTYFKYSIIIPLSVMAGFYISKSTSSFLLLITNELLAAGFYNIFFHVSLMVEPWILDLPDSSS